MALSAYRHILRSTRIAFQGDTHLLHASRLEARKGFDKLANIPPDSPEASTALTHAEEVARILRQNVVQGEQTDGGKFQLRIHEQIERGDNDSVKMPNGKTVKVEPGKGCS